MSFVGESFVYFIAIFCALWLLARRSENLRLAVMLVGSLAFYSFNRWWTLGVIGSFCLVDWGVGLLLISTRRRRFILCCGVAFNIGTLAFYKYTPLAVSSIAAATGVQLVSLHTINDWVIPLGISFFAFSGITYMADVYTGAVKPEPNFWRYSLFASFFPHLVAGPILRAREFLVHLRSGELPDRPLAAWEGTFLIARGYFKKTVLADTIAGAIDPFFANVSNLSTDGVWSLPYVYLYALQIYLDFSGYTDIARGLGLWFGFRWPENFAWPYLAASIQEFWRRWHMTLSRFLRDYLYIPLGGSRHGPVRTTINLMITMLLGGLWHGASWTFALWGLLHGVFLLVNHGWHALPFGRCLAQLHGVGGIAYRLFGVVLTFHSVCFAWCFFRLTNLHDAIVCVRKLVLFDPDKAFVGDIADVGLWLLLGISALATAAGVAISRGEPLCKTVPQPKAAPILAGLYWGGAVGLLVIALLLAPWLENAPFIYFRF